MTTKRLVRISYFTMLTIIGGLISIELPFAPTIKITFQTLFVAASGLILGGKDGAFAQIAYMVIGLIGVPVFSRGGGPTYVLQPSFGYILSFPLQAFLTGFLASKFKTINSHKLFLCAAAGVLASYIVGISYQVMALVCYSSHMTFVAAIMTVPSVLLMLVKDIVLVYVLCLVYPRIMTMIGKRNEQAKPLQDESPEPQSAPEPSDNGEEPDNGSGGEEKPKKNPVPEPAGMTNNE